MNQLLLYLNGQKIKVLSNHIFALFLLITENPHGQVFTRFLGLHFPELQLSYKSVPHFARSTPFVIEHG